VAVGSEELNAIILEDQALPQITGTSLVNCIPFVEIVVSLNKIFFIMGSIKIINYL